MQFSCVDKTTGAVHIGRLCMITDDIFSKLLLITKYVYHLLMDQKVKNSTYLSMASYVSCCARKRILYLNYVIFLLEIFYIWLTMSYKVVVHWGYV